MSFRLTDFMVGDRVAYMTSPGQRKPFDIGVIMQDMYGDGIYYKVRSLISGATVTRGGMGLERMDDTLRSQFGDILVPLEARINPDLVSQTEQLVAQSRVPTVAPVENAVNNSGLCPSWFPFCRGRRRGPRTNRRNRKNRRNTGRHRGGRK